ncbi:hypothetical protein GCM10009835_41560 [Planosporangium flavigriseum]|uniref:Nucleotidyl transferase AbiEii toxin, Type IV TA system n=1 Tax=Planosporangium flavigriseum TaxID=373681 RepID=A0A8J3PKZ9_9ACTN|nr:hypothetical protein Pfl04_23250 [Planosporangium flavigriseum]
MTAGSPAIVMPPLSKPLTFLWHLLFDLSEAMPDSWCLIGGQMVALHGLEHGRTDARPSADGDVLVDIRAQPTALRRVTDFLTNRSFRPDPSPQGLVHRFMLGLDSSRIVVDVLAPDNVGARADLTTSPPGRTLQVPGGSQALRRTEYVTVQVEDRTGRIPRPSLLAAILGKAAALTLPGDARRHLHDLAFLLALMPDPMAARGELTRTERNKLRSCPLADRSHHGWAALPAKDANAGHAALLLLGAHPAN